MNENSPAFSYPAVRGFGLECLQIKAAGWIGRCEFGKFPLPVYVDVRLRDNKAAYGCEYRLTGGEISYVVEAGRVEIAQPDGAETNKTDEGNIYNINFIV